MLRVSRQILLRLWRRPGTRFVPAVDGLMTAHLLSSRAGKPPHPYRHSTPKGWRWDSARASLRLPTPRAVGWGTRRIPWRPPPTGFTVPWGRPWPPDLTPAKKDAASPFPRSDGPNPFSQLPWRKNRRTRSLSPSRCASSPFLRHRLRAKLSAWTSLGASRKVQRWIREGVTPEFKRTPRPFHLGVSCETATPAQRAFLLQEKERLISVGAWEKATCKKYVSRAFLVPKPGGWRLVVDLRWLNQHCKDFGFRYETLKVLSTTARKGDYFFSFDLQDGFYQIGLHPDYRKFFTVELPDGDCVQFASLPMGWNASPYIFCKTMAVWVQHARNPGLRARIPRSGEQRRLVWYHPPARRPGMRILPYVDDFLVSCRDVGSAYLMRHRVSILLDRLGLVRHPDKGQWTPTQVIDHLGLRVDSVRGLFMVTPKRVERIKQMAKALITMATSRARVVPTRQIASFFVV